jgi:hypothetical protein
VEALSLADSSVKLARWSREYELGRDRPFSRLES